MTRHGLKHTTDAVLNLDEKGATTVEAASVVFPFFLIIFGIIQLAVLAFQSVSLQYTLNEAARWGILGYTVESQEDPGVQLNRADSMLARVKSNLKSFSNTSDVDIFFCSISEPECTKRGNPPGSQQWMVVRAEKTVQGLLGVGTQTISASILAMNEPF